MPSKYHNVKCEMDNHKFDSIKEREHYVILKVSKQAGEIANFSIKPTLWLIRSKDNFHITWDKTYAKNNLVLFRYTPDFVMTHTDGTEEIIDVKGGRATQTDVFKLKKRILEALGLKITIK